MTNLLQNNFLVLMMGYTGAGKSTTAKNIASKINCDLHHSAITRKELDFSFTKEEAEEDFFLLTSKSRLPMDEKVYGRLTEKARESLLQNKSVIIDSGNFFKWQRSNLYKKVSDLKPEIIVLRVKCSEEEILKRLEKRKQDFSNSPLNETPSIKTYESSKQVTENPEEDILPNEGNPAVIDFNSSTKEISTLNNLTENIKLIISTLT